VRNYGFIFLVSFLLALRVLAETGSVTLSTIKSLTEAEFGFRGYVYFFGGGGESAGSGSDLITGATSVAELSHYSWNVQIWFGDNTRNSDRLALQAITKGSVVQFTNESFVAALNILQHDILAGKIKSGQQLLLVVDSHGGPGGTGANDLGIVSTGNGSVSRNVLEVVKKAAELKGVKLAIIDASCYSGESLELGSAKTCVVTSTNQKNIAYIQQPLTLFRTMHSFFSRGSNLEQNFLDSRGNKNYGLNWQSFHHMQISTQAGMQTLNEIEIFDSVAATDDTDPKNHDQFSAAQVNNINNALREVQLRHLLPPELNSTQIMNDLKRYVKLRVVVDPLLQPDKICGPTFGSCMSFMNALRENRDLSLYPPLFHYYQLHKAEVTELGVLVQRLSDIELQLYARLYKQHTREHVNSPNPCKDFYF